MGAIKGRTLTKVVPQHTGLISNLATRIPETQELRLNNGKPQSAGAPCFFLVVTSSCVMLATNRSLPPPLFELTWFSLIIQGINPRILSNARKAPVPLSYAHMVCVCVCV